MFTVWFFEFKPEISHKNGKTVSGIESSQKKTQLLSHCLRLVVGESAELHFLLYRCFHIQSLGIRT